MGKKNKNLSKKGDNKRGIEAHDGIEASIGTQSDYFVSPGEDFARKPISSDINIEVAAEIAHTDFYNHKISGNKKNNNRRKSNNNNNDIKNDNANNSKTDKTDDNSNEKINGKTKNMTKKAVTDIVFALLNLSMTVASCFLLNELNKIIRVSAVLTFLILCIMTPSVSERFESFRRLLMTASVFLSLTLTTYVILNLTGWIYYLQEFELIKEFILSTKQWGVIVYLAITIFQVVVLPIPAAVTILIGEAIYGAFWAFVLSVIGTYIGSIIAFFLGRTFGKKLAAWMFGEEKTEKYARLLSDKGKGIFVIMLLFPFFPDDLLCMAAGISNMSNRFFLISMMLTRPIMIAATAFFGGGDIIPFKGWGIPVWIGIIAVTIALFIVITIIKNKLEKGGKNAETAVKAKKTKQ